MAVIKTLPVKFRSVSVTAGNPVNMNGTTASARTDELLGENCSSLMIKNTHASTPLMVKFYAWGTTPGGALPAATSLRIPASTTLTLVLGTMGDRPGAQNPWFDCTTGTATFLTAQILTNYVT
jgi:hypothetical protein